ncbi:MAG: hypothetical protein HYR55_00710 [Acidobacteria bacterium]|nr:hypothetical protein [Acidobacteriota bacterium]MBI3657287.1 hypothetical protein [Acidobacteriota bacterium]
MLRQKLFDFAISTLLAASLMASTWAQAPNSISYSGLLTNAQGEPREGPFNMTFRIFDGPMGGTPLHVQPIPNVTVRKGQFNVLLGPFADNVFLQGSSSRYVEVQVGPDPPLLPRQQLTSAPFALKVGSINGAQGGTIIGPAATTGTGTIRSANNQVYGNNTAFTTQLRSGDTITSQGQTGTVLDIL